MSRKKLVVLCTVSDCEEAHNIAELLVKEKLAACVNIIGGMESTFRWKGKIEHENEVLLLIKTSEDLFETVKEWIKKIHSYEVPEIIGVSPVTISGSYESWWEENLAEPHDID